MAEHPLFNYSKMRSRPKKPDKSIIAITQSVKT